MDMTGANAAASKCMSHPKNIKASIAQGPQKAIMPHNLERTAFKMLGWQSTSRKFVDSVVQAEAILKSLGHNLRQHHMSWQATPAIQFSKFANINGKEKSAKNRHESLLISPWVNRKAKGLSQPNCRQPPLHSSSMRAQEFSDMSRNSDGTGDPLQSTSLSRRRTCLRCYVIRCTCNPRQPNKQE